MKRLIIHPEDKSTDFLKPIYADLDATVITGGVDQRTLKALGNEADQIMMMGHGSPWGLLSVGKFNGAHVIDDSWAPILREKKDNVFIWCNADEFTEYHDLNGFYTGMFISEVGEARMMGLGWWTNQRDIDASNDAFVGTVSKFADRSAKVIHAAARHEYGKFAENNDVARYNHARLYAA